MSYRTGSHTVFHHRDAGTSYAIDRAYGEIGRLLACGLITERQADAGQQFEAIATDAMGSPSTPDSLAALHKVDGGSHQGDDNASARDVATQAEWRALCTVMDRATLSEVRDVCWNHSRVKSHNILCLGLDLVAKYYNM